MADIVKRIKTDVEIRAQKKYMEKFCEVKVKKTTERRTEIQEYAANMGESTLTELLTKLCRMTVCPIRNRSSRQTAFITLQ